MVRGYNVQITRLNSIILKKIPGIKSEQSVNEQSEINCRHLHGFGTVTRIPLNVFIII